MLKYHQAEKLLMDKIAAFPPGTQLPPVRQLIEDSGFSQATIMKAISLLEKRNLVERRPGSGIFTASPKVEFHGSAAVMISVIDNHASSQVLRGIQNALAGADNQIMLLGGGEQLENILPTLKRTGIRKLIIYPQSSDLKKPDFMKFIEHLGESEISVATIEIPIPGLRCVFVGQENTRAFEEVTISMISRGVKSIAVAGMFNSMIYASRLAGIRNAISASGKQVYLRQIDEGDGGNAATIARKLLEDRSDAILLCNAESSREIAYGLRILAGASLNDIAVAGVVEQNERLPLSNSITLEKQSIELGQAAVQALASSRVPARYLPMKIHYSQSYKDHTK